MFNENPKKGIEFCIENKIFKRKPRDIVKFLKNNPCISKFSLGIYFGDPNELNQAVLKQFASLFKYDGSSIDEALRKYLAEFRLPGEGDQITRILEQFSETYYN